MSDSTGRKYEATGTVKYLYASDDKCICCEGNHVFSRQLLVDDYVNEFNFFRHVLFDRKNIDGKRFRITVEIEE